MAQLRDSKTSEFIAEGTPLQMAKLAMEVGIDEVIFDDVGVGFDPQSVLDLHAERVDSVVGDDDAAKEYQKQIVDESSLEPDLVKAASAAIDEARAKLDKG